MSSGKTSLPVIVLGVLMAWPALTYADQPPANVPPPNVPASNMAAAPSSQDEAPTFLDNQSKAERNRALDKQQKTYDLQIDAKYAAALKAYCDTGYGDERCFKADVPKSTPTPAFAPPPAKPLGVSTPNVPPPPNLVPPAPAQQVAVRELPTVVQIAGFGDDLTAILSFPGGDRLRVVGPDRNGPRSQLPGGEQVVSILPGAVWVQGSGDAKPKQLLFSGGMSAVGGKPDTQRPNN